MAVPFRRTSKTIKRKRRTHKKLTTPQIFKDKDGTYKINHRVNKNNGFYKDKVVLDLKEEHQ